MMEFEKKLQSLASKRDEWSELPLTCKIDILEDILVRLQDGGAERFMDLGRNYARVQGIPPTTLEGQVAAGTDAYLNAGGIKEMLSCIKIAYECRVVDREKLPAFDTYKAVNGQIVMDVHSGSKEEAIFNQGFKSSVWLGPETKDESQIKMLEYPTESGVMVVLGAGNQSFLSVIDVLAGLFIQNKVVLLKQHPLRGFYLEPFMRHVLAPLYEKGYLDSVLHTTDEEVQALVYSPLTDCVHMTGGKLTHDLIVWGSTPEEQTQRRKENKPKVKHMTSELGCVTPWIVTPWEYTEEEWKHQAECLLYSVAFCSSANCNSSRVVIVSDEWSQCDDFKNYLFSLWRESNTPVAYYPGATERWKKFEQAYQGKTKLIESETGQGEKERELSTPMLGKGGAVLLPLLVVELEVDLSTKKGKEAAKSEYALQTETFAPTLAFVKIKNGGGREGFLKTATTLCNDYMFGSLCCTITVPPALEGSPEVEGAIADLKYGAVVTNRWAAAPYFNFALHWGGFRGERLEAIESGTGAVGNCFGIANVEKSVFRTPPSDPRLKFERDLSTSVKVFGTLLDLIVEPKKPMSFGSSVAAAFGIPFTYLAVGGGVAALFAAMLVSQGNKELSA